MRQRNGGFTLIEVLVVIAILATIAGMVALIIPGAEDRKARLACIQHVRDLGALVEAARDDRYPNHSGANLLLYLVVKAHLQGDDALGNLFCPGDLEEDLDGAGGEEAYRSLDLTREAEYGHLTSYAGRAMKEKHCRVSKGSPRPVVLIADDSEDHHNGKGIVVGLTGGATRFRDKVDDYGIGVDTPLVIGADSGVEELTCLRAD